MSIFTQAIIAKIILSLTLIFLVWLGSRTVSNKIRNHQPLIDENQRRWISTTKNIAATIGFISVMMVWWPELKEFALSIAAVAVAMVIAAKELILCVSGTIFRTISRPYTIGDWIEIGNLRGEVIDQSPLSTTIQEIVNANDRYDYTGRTVVIPNSLLLNTPVKNMNFMRHYVFHSFTLTTEPEVNLFNVKPQILASLNRYRASYMDAATQYYAKIEKRAGLDIANLEPIVSISTTNQGKSNFSVTLFCPTERAPELEQKISEEFFRWYYQQLDNKNS